MFESKGPLYQFKINNIVAYCNAWAYYEEHNYRQILFASLIGPATILKGIRGTLDSSQQKTVGLDPVQANEIWETMRGHESVHLIHTNKMNKCHREMAQIKDLQPTQSNLIVWARQRDEDQRFNPRYALARTQEELPTMYLQYMLENTVIMALPHWANAIYEFAVEKELIEPIHSHNLAGCIIRGGEQEIINFISENLRDKKLPIPPPQQAEEKPEQAAHTPETSPQPE